MCFSTFKYLNNFKILKLLVVIPVKRKKEREREWEREREKESFSYSWYSITVNTTLLLIWHRRQWMIFDSKDFLGPTKFGVLKIFWSRKILGPTKFWFQQNFATCLDFTCPDLTCLDSIRTNLTCPDFPNTFQTPTRQSPRTHRILTSARS